MSKCMLRSLMQCSSVFFFYFPLFTFSTIVCRAEVSNWRSTGPCFAAHEVIMKEYLLKVILAAKTDSIVNQITYCTVMQQLPFVYKVGLHGECDSGNIFISVSKCYFDFYCPFGDSMSDSRLPFIIAQGFQLEIFFFASTSS